MKGTHSAARFGKYSESTLPTRPRFGQPSTPSVRGCLANEGPAVCSPAPGPFPASVGLPLPSKGLVGLSRHRAGGASLPPARTPLAPALSFWPPERQRSGVSEGQWLSCSAQTLDRTRTPGVRPLCRREAHRGCSGLTAWSSLSPSPQPPARVTASGEPPSVLCHSACPGRSTQRTECSSLEGLLQSHFP